MIQVRRVVQLCCLLCAALVVSCTSVKTVATDVMDELVHLLDSGQLPGIKSGELIESAHVQSFPQYYKIKYPATVAVFVTRKDEDSVYSYVFTKLDAKDKWTLTSAGKRSQNGEHEDLKIVH
jgi:hypothetical protein